jgi:hypothetical protein
MMGLVVWPSPIARSQNRVHVRQVNLLNTNVPMVNAMSFLGIVQVPQLLAPMTNPSNAPLPGWLTVERTQVIVTVRLISFQIALLEPFAPRSVLRVITIVSVEVAPRMMMIALQHRVLPVFLFYAKMACVSTIRSIATQPQGARGINQKNVLQVSVW